MVSICLGFFGQTPVVKTVIPEEINIDLASFTSENGILMLNGGILPQPISKRFKWYDQKECHMMHRFGALYKARIIFFDWY